MSERVVVDRELREVREQFEEVRVRLEALSVAIWHDIDHDDPARLEEGVRFKQGFNEKRRSLEDAIEQMMYLLGDYPNKGCGEEASAPQGQGVAEEGGKADEAEQSAPATGGSGAAAPLAPGLDQKLPFGFILGDKTYTSASAWPLFYEALLQELHGRAPERLERLADDSGRSGKGGKRLFAREPGALDDPLPVADGIFAEADLAPEDLLQVIKGLIAEMGYPLDSVKILLKEKNRGTVETLSLAA